MVKPLSVHFVSDNGQPLLSGEVRHVSNKVIGKNNLRLVVPEFRTAP